jgi:ATP-dependent protease ClpP protease subunit
MMCEGELLEVEKSSFEDQIIYNAFKNDRTIYLWGEINSYRALLFNRMMTQLMRKDGDIRIIINTPGGDVFSMFSIVSTIESAQRNGFHIIGETHGMCMSAGINIIAACSHRVSQSHCRFMFHDLGGMTIGFLSREDSKDELAEKEALWEKVRNLIVRDTNVDVAYIDDIVSRKKEKYFWAEQALEFGLIDEIR